jgi:hypothetical protein
VRGGAGRPDCSGGSFSRRSDEPGVCERRKPLVRAPCALDRCLGAIESTNSSACWAVGTEIDASQRSVLAEGRCFRMQTAQTGLWHRACWRSADESGSRRLKPTSDVPIWALRAEDIGCGPEFPDGTACVGRFAPETSAVGQRRAAADRAGTSERREPTILEGSDRSRDPRPAPDPTRRPHVPQP